MKYKLLNFKFLFTASIIFFGLFGLTKSSLAADYYFAQSVAGSANGTSCANAYAIGDGSSTGASSSTYWVAGNTLHLCGTITGSAGAGIIYANGSGSSGSPITLKFESGASIQAPYMGNASSVWGAIHLGGASYITIDGGATGQIGGIKGNASYVNGYMANTAAGTSGSTACLSGSCTYQVDSIAISASGGGSHIIIKNLAIYDLYVRTSTTDETTGNSSPAPGQAIFLNDNSGPTTNVLVTNCLMHDLGSGLVQQYTTGTGPMEMSFTTIYNANWNYYGADRGANSSLTGLLIHDNWVYNWQIWNDTVGNDFHHDGFFPVTDNSGSVITNPTFYNNMFGPGFGNSYHTGAIYCNENIDGVTVFNNIFIAGTGEYVGNELITCGSSTTSPSSYYNNTFIHNGWAIGTSPSATGTSNIKNNLGYALSTSDAGGQSSALIYTNSITAGSTWGSNNNSYYGYGSPQEPFLYSSSTHTLAQWQSATSCSGCDANDVTTNPNVTLPSISYASYTNYNIDTLTNPTTVGQLASGSPAIGAGANLASLGITGTTATNSVCTGSGTPLSGCTGTGTGSYGTYSLATDLAGVARPSTGAWDIGAYEYSSGSSDTTPPAAPSGLSVN